MKPSTLLALILLVPFSSCGVGTEIGNGFKPDKGDSTGNKTTAADSASPSAGTPTDQATGGEYIPNVNAGAMKVLDLKMLYTSCASPFANIPHDPLTLYEVVDGLEPLLRLKATWVAATNNDAAHWLLHDPKDAVLARIERDTAHPPTTWDVTIVDADHNPMVDAYECGDVTESIKPQASPATIPTKTVEVPLLKDDKLISTLSWTLEDGKLTVIKTADTTLKPKE